MPIPQLSKRKYQQSWKDQDKKTTKKKTKKYKKKLDIKKIIFNRKTLVVCFILFFIGVIGLFGTIAWISKDLPSPNQLINREIAQSTKIYDRTGNIVLYEIHGEEQRTLMTLDDIPDYVEEASIAIEDKNFYKHNGFSISAIIRTAITDFIYNKRAGASTITQQLVKNSILTSEKTITRKVKEIILAYRLEKKFSKNEILQMYLNEIPYGSTAYGIEAASRHYFGKSCTELSIGEGATLAALPQAPSYYSPYGSRKELLLQRKDYILKLLNEQGYISKKEMEDAKKQKIVFKEPSRDIKAPHFVMYIKSQLVEKYGQKMVEQGGLKIITTLDMYKQKIAEDIIKDRAVVNLKNYNASNAALISLDPKTGQILAMVGSKDYFSDSINGKFNVTTASRQPGSSIKPIIYASLFEKGYTPNTKLFDVITNFSNDKENPYEPKNYNLKEYGAVSIRQALAGSLNIPAVKALYLTGVKDASEFAQSLGYTTLGDYKKIGLSLVLGGGEVKLIEHVNAYSAFARDGVKHPISSILKVEDSKGKTLEEFKNKEENVFDKKIARMINSILSDNDARSFTYGLNNWLTLGDRPVCAKTGTTNSYRDAWTIGYTPSLVTGVWVGNNDNSEMRRGASGGNVAAPIWNGFMKQVLGDTPIEEFKKPEDLKTNKPAIDGTIKYEKSVKIDSVSGFLATEYTPKEFIKTVTFAQKPHSILYYVNREDPLGESPKNPEEDPQFNLWENAISVWFDKNSTSTSITSTSTLSTTTLPIKTDNIHKPEYRPTIKILSPNNKSVVTNPNFEVKIKLSAPRGIYKVDYYINDILLTSKTTYPFNFNDNISFLDNGYHDLKIKACDDVGNCSEKNLVFNLKLPENKFNKVSASWVEPANGIIVNKIDFPLNLKLNLSDYKKISKIDILAYTPADHAPINITTINNPNSENVEIKWDKPKDTGVYKIIANVLIWDNSIIKTNELIITVN